MLISQIDAPVLIFLALFLLALGLAFMVAASSVFRPWFQGYMAGAPISVARILSMQMRKVDVRVVVRALVMATQAGVAVSLDDLERAYLQGADLEKIMHALIQANKAGNKFTFQELVDADLEN